MKERKRRGGLAQAAAAFLAVYAAVTLLPAAVYGASRLQEDGSKGPAQSSIGTEESSSAPDTPPGFLDAASLPKESGTGSEDVFTLYDQASGETLSLTAEELLPGAVACEMDLSSPQEALKAQTVACYTLFCWKRAQGEDILCDSERWQTWTTPERMRERWGEDTDACLETLRTAAEAVSGQMLTLDGEPIMAAYFAISAGATETAGNVWGSDLPYLQSAASPGDMLSDGYLSTVRLTEEEFRNAAASAFGEEADLSGDPETWLTELKYTPSGYVSSGVLGGRETTGAELRSAFSLRSACFRLERDGEDFLFTVRGWGHGVGMSQAGAVFLAKRGESFQNILAHYYPGTVLTNPA